MLLSFMRPAVFSDVTLNLVTPLLLDGSEGGIGPWFLSQSQPPAFGSHGLLC